MEALDEGKAFGFDFLIFPELAFYSHLTIVALNMTQFISKDLQSLDNMVAASSRLAIKALSR